MEGKVEQFAVRLRRLDGPGEEERRVNASDISSAVHIAQAVYGPDRILAVAEASYFVRRDG